jgi:hypothetical protein
MNRFFYLLLLSRLALGSLSADSLSAHAFASEPQRISIDQALPYGQQPVDYWGATAQDAVQRLNRRLAKGEIELPFDDERGYLMPLLKALNVPVESQLLVFSKTALNPQLVEPKRPRAVYFNDEVAVGWVPEAAALEISAVDPHLGGQFYTLAQSAERQPQLVREQRCLACHAGATTLQVPGFMVRSFLTDDAGKPVVGYSRITHETDLAKRWGGWYVTGKPADLTHRGNLIGEADRQRHQRDSSFRGNVAHLEPFFDVATYPTTHSDVVAHLVFNHQMHGLNLLIRVNLESRLNRRSDAEDQLLRYLLFADEAPLASPVEGASGYTGWFERQGPADSQGRSLRQFDLHSRLFRYRLSYLIYTPAFEGLPIEVKERVYVRLWEEFTGNGASEASKHLESDERSAILAILRATKKDLPECFERVMSDE